MTLPSPLQNWLEQLITRDSTTPDRSDCLKLIGDFLSGLGFKCEYLRFGPDDGDYVDNLWAEYGNNDGPHICFAGHTDVVPAGDQNLWQYPAFEASFTDKHVYGRGISDMKGSIACFLYTLSQLLTDSPTIKGRISLLLTGDEEGISLYGTKPVVAWLQQQSEKRYKPDFCIVGEPSNIHHVGSMLKIGRRGSLNCVATIHGQQGHVAYHTLCHNPMPVIAGLATMLSDLELDQGSTHFQPSNLEITGLHTDNRSENVIPDCGRVRFNIRFNDNWNGKTLQKFLEDKIITFCTQHNVKCDLNWRLSGDSFYTPPGQLVQDFCQIVNKVTGHTPELSTSGGTSDARFIKDLCPVMEFGLVSDSIHKIDEFACQKDILLLSQIYRDFLQKQLL